jgi:hypothetical protein
MVFGLIRHVLGQLLPIFAGAVFVAVRRAHLFGQPVPIVRDAGIDRLQIDRLGALRLLFHLSRALTVFFRAFQSFTHDQPLSLPPGKRNNAIRGEAFQSDNNSLCIFEWLVTASSG